MPGVPGLGSTLAQQARVRACVCVHGEGGSLQTTIPLTNGEQRVWQAKAHPGRWLPDASATLRWTLAPASPFHPCATLLTPQTGAKGWKVFLSLFGHFPFFRGGAFRFGRSVGRLEPQGGNRISPTQHLGSAGNTKKRGEKPAGAGVSERSCEGGMTVDDRLADVVTSERRRQAWAESKGKEATNGRYLPGQPLFLVTSLPPPVANETCHLRCYIYDRPTDGVAPFQRV